MLSQSTIALADMRWASMRGSNLRRTGRLVGSTPMTSKVPSTMRDLDLVRADEPGTDDVDQMASREVLCQQELARPPLEPGEVERLALELDASGTDTSDH